MVDSNIRIDVFERDPVWYGWSRRMLAIGTELGSVAISPIVNAEVSAGFRMIERLKHDLYRLNIEMLDFPRAAPFLAGHKFRVFRQRSRADSTIMLPDFLIGAHAAVLGFPFLTRDLRRYRT